MNKEVGIDDYSSSWDWCVERSDYHFDWSIKDKKGEWFTPLGRFRGDWSADLKKLDETQQKSITWSNRKNYRDKVKHIPSLSKELNDLEDSGMSTELVLTDRYDFVEDFPALYQISQHFKLVDDGWFSAVIHNQKPGHMFNLHIDKFWEKLEPHHTPDDVIRIMVMLDDWKPGQFYGMGTYTYSHWKAGDCFTWPWQTTPHTTANASKWNRPALMVTGFKSEATRILLEMSNEFTEHCYD